MATYIKKIFCATDLSEHSANSPIRKAQTTSWAPARTVADEEEGDHHLLRYQNGVNNSPLQ